MNDPLSCIHHWLSKFFLSFWCLFSPFFRPPACVFPSKTYFSSHNEFSFSLDSSISQPSPAEYLLISVLFFDPPPHAFSMHVENFSFTHSPYSVHIHVGFFLFTYSTALVIYHLKKFTTTAFSFLSLWVIHPWISFYIRLPLLIYVVWISHQDAVVYDFLQSLVDFPTKCQG